MPWSWGHTASHSQGLSVGSAGRGDPMGSSPRAGQGTEGPVDRGSPEMVLWDQPQCSEGMQQTGRSMPASTHRESVRTEIKKKISIKCATQGPDTRIFNTTCLACCLCTPVWARPPCSSQGPLTTATHGWAGCWTRDQRQHSRPSPDLTEKPWEQKWPKYFTCGYIQRLHLQIFPVFSFFSLIY